MLKPRRFRSSLLLAAMILSPGCGSPRPTPPLATEQVPTDPPAAAGPVDPKGTPGRRAQAAPATTAGDTEATRNPNAAADSKAAADLESRYDEALRLARGGRHRQAVERFTALLRLAPNHAGAYRNRGACLARLKQFADAKRDLNRAIALNPRDAAAYFNRGFVHDELAVYEAAIDDFNSAIAFGGKPPAPRVLVSRGLSRFKSGDTRGAIRDYTLGLEADPKMKLAYLLRAEAYERQADFAAARRDRDRAQQLP